MHSLTVATVCCHIFDVRAISVQEKEPMSSFMEIGRIAEENETALANTFATKYAPWLIEDHNGNAGEALAAFMLQHQETLARDQAKQHAYWEKWERQRALRRAQKAGDSSTFPSSDDDDSSDPYPADEPPITAEDLLLVFQDLMSLSSSADLQRLKAVADDTTVIFLTSRMERDSTVEIKEMLRRLIEEGFNVRAVGVNQYGRTKSALANLVYEGVYDMAMLLHAHGAELQEEDYMYQLKGADGKVYFARNNWTTRWFRDNGCDIDRAMIALIQSIDKGGQPVEFLEVFMDLVDMGADLRLLLQKSGSSAFGWVAMCILKHEEFTQERMYLIERMVEAGFNIDHTLQGHTALSKCLYSDAFNEDAMRKIIQLGADVNLIDRDNQHYLNTAASKYGHPLAVDILLENGADLKLAFDALAAQGWTLHLTEMIRNLCGLVTRKLQLEAARMPSILQRCLPPAVGPHCPRIAYHADLMRVGVKHWASIIQRTRVAFEPKNRRFYADAIAFLKTFERELLSSDFKAATVSHLFLPF